MKTSIVAFLPHEPQKLVKTSPEKVLKAKAGTHPSLLSKSHLITSHQLLLGLRPPPANEAAWRPHLRAEGLIYVSTQAGQRPGAAKECRVECATSRKTSIKGKDAWAFQNEETHDLSF